MGTRADFYVGRHETAEWLGSIAWDGYRDGIPPAILTAINEADFRKTVARFIESRKDGTRPSEGWPWPWDDSGLSDCSYWFDDGKVWEARSYPNKRYVLVADPEPEDEEQHEAWINAGELVRFPNMKAVQKVTFGERSGVTIFRVPT